MLHNFAYRRIDGSECEAFVTAQQGDGRVPPNAVGSGASLRGAGHSYESAFRIFEMADNESIGRRDGTHDSSAS